MTQPTQRRAQPPSRRRPKARQAPTRRSRPTVSRRRRTKPAGVLKYFGSQMVQGFLDGFLHPRRQRR